MSYTGDFPPGFVWSEEEQRPVYKGKLPSHKHPIQHATVPARRPEDDALDRLERGITEFVEPWEPEHYPQLRRLLPDIATVREALERQREERDYAREGWNEALAGHQACGESLLECSAKREAAEAEVRQLREREQNLRGELRRSDLRVRRLTEGLRDLREQAAPREWETRGHPMNDWTKREPILRKIDALLSANPPQGDAAEGSNPSDDDPPCPRCGMTAQVEASRSEPGRWMCHGCAQTFASPSDGGGA